VKKDTFDVELTYERERNKHIQHEDACWGTATIRIEKNANKGKAKWIDLYDSDHNGTCEWELYSNGLFKNHKRQSASRQQRQQEMFRSMLLEYDKCCTISGEKTPDALEAAHIIPSQYRGAEVVENGILLRADLHRLYDSGHFTIDPKGNIVNVHDVSGEYCSLLKGAHLLNETATRIQEALSYQWGKAAGV
jgi:hypothetical protein